MPTSTAVPPTGNAAIASSTVDRRPIAPNTKSGPPPDPSPTARPADPARDQPGERHQIPDPWRVDSRPGRLDDAGPLVTHDDRRRMIPLPVANVQVGVADTGREHPHAHLAGARLDQIELTDDDRAPDLLQDRATHRHAHRASIVARWSHCPPVSAGPTATARPRCSRSTSMPRRSC